MKISSIIKLFYNNLVFGPILGLFMGIIVLFGCSKTPQVLPLENKTINRVEIYDFFSTNGYASGVCSDNNYSIIKKEFLDWDYGKLLLGYYMGEGIMYSGPRMDCEKLSLQSIALIQRINYKDNVDKGVAFGMLYYIRKEDNQAHAINFALVLNNKSNIVLEAYEPQLFKPVNLTEKELASIYFWIL